MQYRHYKLLSVSSHNVSSLACLCTVGNFSVFSISYFKDFAPQCFLNAQIKTPILFKRNFQTNLRMTLLGKQMPLQNFTTFYISDIFAWFLIILQLAFFMNPEKCEISVIPFLGSGSECPKDQALLLTVSLVHT